MTDARIKEIREGSRFPVSLNPGFYTDAVRELLADLERLPACHICHKPKGQGPERCNGHYEGTSSAPSDKHLERARKLRLYLETHIKHDGPCSDNAIASALAEVERETARKDAEIASGKGPLGGLMPSEIACEILKAHGLETEGRE